MAEDGQAGCDEPTATAFQLSLEGERGAEELAITGSTATAFQLPQAGASPCSPSRSTASSESAPWTSTASTRHGEVDRTTGVPFATTVDDLGHVPR
jgi:hypothetical protein